MTKSLPHDVLASIAEEVSQIGPRDHGANRNRWGSIKARVDAARVEMGLPARGTGDDNTEVWKMIKRISRTEAVA